MHVLGTRSLYAVYKTWGKGGGEKKEIESTNQHADFVSKTGKMSKMPASSEEERREEKSVRRSDNTSTLAGSPPTGRLTIKSEH